MRQPKYLPDPFAFPSPVFSAKACSTYNQSQRLMATSLLNQGKELPNLSPLFFKKFTKFLNLIREMLSQTPYMQPESSNMSVKSILESLLPKDGMLNPNCNMEEAWLLTLDFCLCCAALASASDDRGTTMSWVPMKLSEEAAMAIKELSGSILGEPWENGSMEMDFGAIDKGERLMVALMPRIMPILKGSIKETSIDTNEDMVEAACARAPKEYAIVAAHQLRWWVKQVNQPHLGKLCAWVIPCALTALDHWSPEVKGQAMISFMHLSINMSATEFGSYGDVVLDASYRNIAAADEIWQYAVEMSVLLLTCIECRNPRSYWYERILGDMLGHLERQPNCKERRIPWLQQIEPIFNAMGLVLLAHLKRVMTLFFDWMHADDDRSVLLVLERIYTIMKLIWVRNTPYLERLVDELTVTYREASLRKERFAIREHVLKIMFLLQRCILFVHLKELALIVLLARP
ncbi:uncharacterized protein At2g39910 isoform X2 [Amborella trichopoda]|uniref:uncharacterized protein At2g39910 isoform X2 n=1 Tax=Amborella trichopoda TaxID=13333 RepID=UPI0009BE3E9B|nr:uncharacterized protein At2g39910 isoform X2 [Amborella trichopoda]|eukprot:XP_020523657.1 uncharacterized protein At2g39910 isoform X2 [Amborella trichopoda]